MKKKKPKKKALPDNPCWWCRGELCWDNDFDGEDAGEKVELVTYLHCMKCGATVVYYSKE